MLVNLCMWAMSHVLGGRNYPLVVCGDVGGDTVGQEWGGAAAAAEAARGEDGGGGGRAGPGWRRRVTTMARWEPSAWAHMCGALGKRSHDVMRGETEDVVGD